MKLYTEVEIPNAPWGIGHSDRLMLLGSCFATDIGERLTDAGFRTQVNPLGALYNPASVAVLLDRLIDKRPFAPEDIMDFGAEGYGTWEAHSLLSRPTADEALQVLNERLVQAWTWLHDADVLIVTFGTAWVYRLGGNVVANCHHEPPSRFVRERLTVDDIVHLWQPLFHRLATLRPGLRILFTISPIRHLRDGAHANQLSKATLLLAVETLLRVRGEGLVVRVKAGAANNSNPSPLTSNPTYFPSYEIVLDELRDYRFYADDLTHPAPLAVERVWERFADTYFDASTRQAVRRIGEVTRALRHRPLHSESNECRRFVRQILLKIAEIQKDFPYFEAGNFIDQCHTLLNS